MTLREDLSDIILVSIDASIVIGSYLFLIMAAWMMTIFAGVLGLCFLADVIYGMWWVWKRFEKSKRTMSISCDDRFIFITFSFYKRKNLR